MVAVLTDVVLLLLALPVWVASAYLMALVLFSRRRAPPAYPAPHLRFDLVVPAHDEEAGIAATVQGLQAVDYPRELRRIVVVADNCTDATAERARRAGAVVLVRHEPGLRGKGYALAHAFDWCLSQGFADAIVVVDADTRVSANLLHAFAARLDQGALAVQSDNRVRNPGDSWRTRLMAIAFVLFVTLRSLGRERLGCSTGLRGTGMCLRASLLREVPHHAYSVVEDLEYGIRIGMGGHRVRFADEAAVMSDMVSSAEASRSQRRRWELGRLRIARKYGVELVRRGLRTRDRVLLDLGLDLLVPPLAYLAAVAVAGTTVAALASSLAGRPLGALAAWGASVVLLCAYVARGWWLSGTGLAGLLGLLYAPVYLVWKLGVVLGRPGRERQEWIRTSRGRSS